MRIHLLIALAYNCVLSMNRIPTLDGYSAFQTVDYLDEDSRKSFAGTSRLAFETVAEHSQPIDAYIKLFDFPIQAANGCITGNKLRGLDSVKCIKMVTDPVQRLNFHDIRKRRPFNSSHLEILIFNAITLRNIPVLIELLQIRISTEPLEWSFIQDAYCWALIGHIITDRGYLGLPLKLFSSISDFPGNEACDSLNNFVSSKGYEIELAPSVTFQMVIIFKSRFRESNRQLNSLYLALSFDYARFTYILISRPYPTSIFNFYKFFLGESQLQCLQELLKIGFLIEKGSVCSAVNRFDTDSALLYFKSGTLVDWDFEMDCIAKSKSDKLESTKRKILVNMAIKEMESQYKPNLVPALLYHGLKYSDWAMK